jgi:hypothetical protein
MLEALECVARMPIHVQLTHWWVKLTFESFSCLSNIHHSTLDYFPISCRIDGSV